MSDIQAKMQSLAALRQAGQLTEAEYQRRRQALLDSEFGPTDTPTGSPSGTALDLAEGTELGPSEKRYRLEKRVGRGAMGEVWRALDLADSQAAGKDVHVAIKTLQGLLQGGERHREALRNEAINAKGLHHSHIVNTRDWYIDPVLGIPFIVMEWLDGETLDALLKREKHLPLDAVLTLLHPLAEALEYAWKRNITHRDIKPENVFITRDDTVKLLDFGIAAEAHATGTSLGLKGWESSGSPGYAAPEAGAHGHAGPRQDVYSLAIMAYELLQGSVPFATPRSPTAQPKKPDVLNDAAWQGLQQGWAYNEAERLASARELVQLLAATPVAETGTAIRTLVTTTRPWAIGGAILVALIMAANWGLRTWVELTGKNEPLPPEAMTAAPESAPPAMPAQEDIHGWSTERVQTLQRDTARALGREVVRPEAGQEMVLIPSGCYQMGSPKSEAGHESDEGPQRKVCVKAFELGKTEVTQGQWKAVMGENPSNFETCGLTCPVEQVSWDDIQVFIKNLNAQTGGGYRLPSEAEWEYATRAGTTGPFSFSGPITDQKANYDANYPYEGSPKGEYRERTVEVGSLPANPWGLHEMHGNVWEWVADCWHDSYNGNPPTDGSEWKGGCNGDSRVLRGGSWGNFPRNVRSAYRFRVTPVNRSSGGGFRLARTLP